MSPSIAENNVINVIELGYQKTLYWMIDNEDRENFLQGLFKLLEQIRNNSLSFLPAVKEFLIVYKFSSIVSLPL